MNYENQIKLIIDNDVLDKYHEHYFEKYPRRKKKPIDSPIPPSLNKWMIMPRFQMNSQKQIWKEFGEWLVFYYGFNDLQIEKCNIIITYYFGTKHRHDADNYTPKNLFDSFTSSGLLVDDDFKHVESLTIKGGYCKGDPKTEIIIKILDC